MWTQGQLTIIDGDIVDLSNLHRQVLYGVDDVGQFKADVAARRLQTLYARKVIGRREYLNRQNLPSTAMYDIVLDCTDRPFTRYLISDICARSRTPLVTAAAIGAQGQLMMLISDDESPCYRCIFPSPPPPETVTRCSDAGILGPVVGTLGVLQALQAMKFIIGDNNSNYMILVNAFTSPLFRSITLRPRDKHCIGCGKVDETLLEQSYRALTSVPLLHLVEPRSSVHDLAQRLKYPETLIIDVRDTVQFDICHLDGSTSMLTRGKLHANWLIIDIPYPNNDLIVDAVSRAPPNTHIYLICRFGNDSQLALRDLQISGKLDRPVSDVEGGLEAWSKHVDSSFPIY